MKLKCWLFGHSFPFTKEIWKPHLSKDHCTRCRKIIRNPLSPPKESGPLRLRFGPIVVHEGDAPDMYVPVFFYNQQVGHLIYRAKTGKWNYMVPVLALYNETPTFPDLVNIMIDCHIRTKKWRKWQVEGDNKHGVS